MSRYRPGQALTLTADGRRVTIWSEAPGPGRYWAHLEDSVQLVVIRVSTRRDAAVPIVTLQEEQ